MENLVWSVTLAAIGILGIYIAGKKNVWGWLLGLFAQVLWFVFAIVTGQLGFILSAIAYGAVYGLNAWRWWQESRPPEPEHLGIETFDELIAPHGEPKRGPVRHWNGILDGEEVAQVPEEVATGIEPA